MQDLITKTFGERLRVRVCGLLIENDSILLIKHHYLGDVGHLWIPPGGGMVYGETAEEALKREFLEETGLAICVEALAFVYEFYESPLHAVELFFWVKRETHTPTLLLKGTDPELPADKQLIAQVAYLSLGELEEENQMGLHGSLRYIKSWEEFKQRSFYTLQKK